MDFDLILKNCNIADGTGAPQFKGSVAVAGGKIAAVGEVCGSAETVIDAGGKLVCPGFIDTHSHADCSLFLYPDCESYLRQGITTFIGGQCGDAMAPIGRFWMRKYWEYDFWNEMDPFVFYPRTVLPSQRVIDVVERRTGYRIAWRTFSEYIEVVKSLGIGCNVITLAGHSQIRAEVMGTDYGRAPDSYEMIKMKAHIDDAFEAGAWGLSTGRDYPPSACADFEELSELLRHVKNSGGYHFTHWRRTGVRDGNARKPANKLEGIGEALELALSTGIKTQVAHLSTGFDIYPENEDMDRYAAKVTLDFFDGYRARGADAAFDVIPGTSGGICIRPYLVSLFTPWLKMSGSLENFIRNLKARDYREKLKSHINGGFWYELNPKVCPSWDVKTFITKGPGGFAGKNIRAIAEELGLDSLDTVFEILIQCPRAMAERMSKSSAEVKTLLSHELGFVCTDTYAFDLQGTFGRDMEVPELLPHPNTYCAFPKYLKNYGAARIEDTIHKVTGAPARFFGIKKRGELKPGFYADIVVFDPERLEPNESYTEPRAFPDGIGYVIVNGKVSVSPDGLTGARAGEILKR